MISHDEIQKIRKQEKHNAARSYTELTATLVIGCK
jgi:hypothetical protein